MGSEMCIRDSRQYISYQGNKLQLRIPEFKLDALKRKEYGGLFSVLIPTEPWLRTQLDVIETFVQENVNFTKNLIGAQTRFTNLFGREIQCMYLFLHGAM